ncbi:hypothetical protein, partial [Synechococcus sp. UW140]|uniref:hypothetical protein n=1 Tax=Synechococcus sp. UW140 TaxID=368503 RepID=UPI003138206C
MEFTFFTDLDEKALPESDINSLTDNVLESYLSSNVDTLEAYISNLLGVNVNIKNSDFIINPISSTGVSLSEGLDPHYLIPIETFLSGSLPSFEVTVFFDDLTGKDEFDDEFNLLFKDGYTFELKLQLDTSGIYSIFNAPEDLKLNDHQALLLADGHLIVKTQEKSDFLDKYFYLFDPGSSYIGKIEPTIIVSNVDISDDSGISDTDFITNNATQTITGTLSKPLATGDILYGSIDNGKNWIDITTPVDGVSGVSGAAIEWTGATLVGSSSILFKITYDGSIDSVTTGSTAYILDTLPPTFTSGETAESINENIGAGQVIYTVTSNDTADISDGVKYSLKSGSDSGLFSIDENSGTVSLTANPNYET